MHLLNERVAGRKIYAEHHRLLYVKFRSTFYSILLLLRTDAVRHLQCFQAEKIMSFDSTGTGNQYGYSVAYATTGRPYLSYTMSIGYEIKIPRSTIIQNV